MKKIITEKDIENLKEKIQYIIADIKIPDESTKIEKNWWLKLSYSQASKELPVYYKVYFLLVNLLGFKDLGRAEKTAWSIPIDFEGKAFFIELRKFGLGLYGINMSKKYEKAKKIVKIINKATKMAEPYFDYLANEAIKSSKLTITNNSRHLFERYEYFLKLYEEKAFKDNEDNRRLNFLYGGQSYKLYDRESQWLAMDAIEAFFSWTEHVFVLLAVIMGKVKTGEEVNEIINSDWNKKYKMIFDISKKKDNEFYLKLLSIRRQVRNYMAHGTFSNDMRTFYFHSSTGVIPLNYKNLSKKNFTFNLENLYLNLIDYKTINVLKNFIDFIWSCERKPAKLYIQDSGLPLVLTEAQKGIYTKIMKSSKEMNEYIDRKIWEQERAMNMDF